MASSSGSAIVSKIADALPVEDVLELCQIAADGCASGLKGGDPLPACPRVVSVKAIDFQTGVIG